MYIFEEDIFFTPPTANVGLYTASIDQLINYSTPLPNEYDLVGCGLLSQRQNIAYFPEVE